MMQSKLICPYNINVALSLIKNVSCRKFNVSITRGMSFCAVVGHPEFLYLDPYWKQIINQCVRYGSYEGNLPTDLSVEECDDNEEDFLFSSSIRSVMLEFASSSEMLM